MTGQTDDARAETLPPKRRRILDEEKHVRPDGRTAEEIDRYLQELRGNDRI